MLTIILRVSKNVVITFSVLELLPLIRIKIVKGSDTHNWKRVNVTATKTTPSLPIGQV